MRAPAGRELPLTHPVTTLLPPLPSRPPPDTHVVALGNLQELLALEAGGVLKVVGDAAGDAEAAGPRDGVLRLEVLLAVLGVLLLEQRARGHQRALLGSGERSGEAGRAARKRQCTGGHGYVGGGGGQGGVSGSACGQAKGWRSVQDPGEMVGSVGTVTGQGHHAEERRGAMQPPSLVSPASAKGRCWLRGGAERGKERERECVCVCVKGEQGKRTENAVVKFGHQ